MKLNRAILGVSSKAPPQNRRAGFTILELIVVIVVFLIICGAAITNWASFTQHQNMRKDAIMLHNTLLTAKANAIRDGVEYEIRYNDAGSDYYVIWRGAGGDITPGLVDSIVLRNRVVLRKMDMTEPNPDYDSTDPDSEENIDMTSWASPIKIKPNNIGAFMHGGVVISNGSARMFRIQRGATDVNPRIEYSSNNGATWKEI